MADEQLEEVIHIRIENEQIETKPLLQRYSSVVKQLAELLPPHCHSMVSLSSI